MRRGSDGGNDAADSSDDDTAQQPPQQQQQQPADEAAAALDSLWAAVRKADGERDQAAVTGAVFTFLTFRLQTEANLATGAAIVDLERRLRAERLGTYCVARTTHEPYRSCGFDKQPTPYHLYLVVDTKAKAKEQWREQGCRSSSENVERLHAAGFLDNATEAATRERRLKAVRLPFDLVPATGGAGGNGGGGGGGAVEAATGDAARCRLFDFASIAYHARDHSDALDVRNKCLQHAAAARQGVLSEALAMTGVQVARTSVLARDWERTRAVIERQMRERLPIAESDTDKETYKCVREQMIPIGYQLLGTTREPPHVADDEVDGRRYALFDLYAVTERKYHVSFDDLEYEWYARAKAAPSADDERYLRALLVEKTGVETPDEMKGVNFANVRRHAHVSNRGATPL